MPTLNNVNLNKLYWHYNCTDHQKLNGNPTEMTALLGILKKMHQAFEILAKEKCNQFESQQINQLVVHLNIPVSQLEIVLSMVDSVTASAYIEKINEDMNTLKAEITILKKNNPIIQTVLPSQNRSFTQKKPHYSQSDLILLACDSRWKIPQKTDFNRSKSTPVSPNNLVVPK